MSVRTKTRALSDSESGAANEAVRARRNGRRKRGNTGAIVEEARRESALKTGQVLGEKTRGEVVWGFARCRPPGRSGKLFADPGRWAGSCVMRDITVLIADDHAILRKGLKLLLEFEEGIVVAGEAADGREAVRLARKLKPDVVIMDIAMPLLGGIEATRQIRRELPATQVLVVSATPDEDQVREALGAGAGAFVAKHTSLANVPVAVREIFAGNTFVGVMGRDARLDLRRQRISQALAQLGFTGAVREESEAGLGGATGPEERTG